MFVPSDRVQLILPFDMVDDSLLLGKKNLFFLAGPIKGSGLNWRAEMIQELLALTDKEKIIVVDPTRIYPPDHILLKQHALQSKQKQGEFKSAATWERHYLERAADTKNGCIVFWLPCESKTEPRKDGHPYGLDSRSELGEWRGRYVERKLLAPHQPNYNLAIGTESGFLGERTVRQNFEDVGMSLCSSMNETAKKAMSLLR